MYPMIIFIQHGQVQSLVAGPVLLPLLDSVPHPHHLRGQPEVALVGHLAQGGQGVMWSQDTGEVHLLRREVPVVVAPDPAAEGGALLLPEVGVLARPPQVELVLGAAGQV